MCFEGLVTVGIFRVYIYLCRFRENLKFVVILENLMQFFVVGSFSGGVDVQSVFLVSCKEGEVVRWYSRIRVYIYVYVQGGVEIFRGVGNKQKLMIQLFVGVIVIIQVVLIIGNQTFSRGGEVGGKSVVSGYVGLQTCKEKKCCLVLCRVRFFELKEELSCKDRVNQFTFGIRIVFRYVIEDKMGCQKDWVFTLGFI